MEKFNYEINKDIFKSVGNVKIQDKNQNTYEFSQLYIDTKKKEILGTDSKLYINQNDFKIDERNKPRIFSNASKISKNESIFKKSIFTLCNYRSNDKCPPWSIQSGEMLHDNTKKTIFWASLYVCEKGSVDWNPVSFNSTSLKTKPGILEQVAIMLDHNLEKDCSLITLDQSINYMKIAAQILNY